ncbi:MAG: hypothetical protein MI919_37065, partial [Holophagales bacterium]|nr:hypothetical protein [Holophagales bacterium]
VSATEAAGADLWLQASAPFQARWLGAWVKLEDAASADLGTYRVLELDATGRLRLEGAVGVTGAVSYAGEYRFDAVIELGGGNLDPASAVVLPGP